ncbi:MAG: hypothetical protein ACREJD_07415 [Phycisphaerales bacterium]
MDIGRAISSSLGGLPLRCLLALAIGANASAGVTFRVTFQDSESLLTPRRAEIESNVLGAAGLWSKKLHGETELWIEVHPGVNASDVDCRSFTWSYLETLEGAIDIFETGSSVHIRNGYPASSFDPDIILEISPVFAQNDLWFDPDPVARTAAVDSARIDAVSQFARGLGRALAFDGWVDSTTGTFPGSSRSTFDQLISFNGTDFAFVGSNAVTTYHAPVPMTFGVPFRIGNEPPRPGTDLLNDVMSGASLVPGVRYTVSDLDFAILQDAHVPINLPCPCDINGDGLVDDADFFTFTSSYDAYECSVPSMPAGCPCDFNRDEVVDDADYVTFISSYDQLLCP